MTRDEIIQALSTAPTLRDQISLVAKLDEHDAGVKATAAQARDVDWAGTVVNETLFSRPNTLDRHTAASDWIAEAETSGGENVHQAMVAEAAAWWSKLHPMVKADAGEFTTQAQGMARRTASVYGEAAQEAREAFLQYVAFLNREVLAASGLPQIQQVVDSLENPKPTDLPADVFDTFQPPVHPLNAGVDGQQTNSLAPGAEEAMAEGGGQGGGVGRPSEHDEGQGPVSEPYYPPASAKQGSLTVTADMLHRARENAARQGHAVNFIQSEGANDGWYGTCDGCNGSILVNASGVNNHLGERCNNRMHAVLGSQASVAIGYAYNLDDFKREAAKETREDDDKEEGSDLPFEGAAEPFGGVKKDAASGLQQVQQQTDVHDQPSATPLPQEPMFPIVQPWPETSTLQVLDMGGEDTGPTNRPRQAVRKQADMYGASDSPHAGPGTETPVANSPATTPPKANGGNYDKGVAEGKADAAAQAAPSFADASSHASDYVRGYTDGFGAGQPSPGAQAVPGSMGGDNGQAQNFAETQARQEQPLNMQSKLTVSAKMLSKDVSKDEDFQRGYRYARAWSPGDRIAAIGSNAEEAGIYAGITDAPMLQRGWVIEHRALAKEFPELGQRLANHREVTKAYRKANPNCRVAGLYVRAATSLDLDTMAPSTTPDPNGATPSEGPGTIPILRGAPGTPAAPGGASPYNGAEPMGQSVVPNPSIQDVSSEVETPQSPDAVNVTGDSPLVNSSPQAMAFRKTVQAAKLARRQKEN